MLCDDLQGWGGKMGGRLKRKRLYIYTHVADSHAVQKTLTQLCKVIILQLKLNNRM